MILVLGSVVAKEGSIGEALDLSRQHVLRSRMEPGMELIAAAAVLRCSASGRTLRTTFCPVCGCHPPRIAL